MLRSNFKLTRSFSTISDLDFTNKKVFICGGFQRAAIPNAATVEALIPVVTFAEMGGMKSQTQPQIRTFAPEDYNSVLQLWQASGLRIKASDTLAELRKLDQDLFLVAEKIQGGLIVGAVIGAWDGRRAWIYHLAVSPTARRTGIGSLLMSEVEKRLRARGALKINLLVESDNLKAGSFYRSLSYEEMPFVFFTKEI